MCRHCNFGVNETLEMSPESLHGGFLKGRLFSCVFTGVGVWRIWIHGLVYFHEAGLEKQYFLSGFCASEYPQERKIEFSYIAHLPDTRSQQQGQHFSREVNCARCFHLPASKDLKSTCRSPILQLISITRQQTRRNTVQRPITYQITNY